MEKDAFNYTISSQDRTNDIGTPTVFYNINFGGFSNLADNYKIEVVNLVLSGSVLEANGYLILTAEGLHDDGIFCPQKLSTRDCVIATIPTNVDTLMSNGGVCFKSNNCRINKNIKFNLLLPNFDSVEDDVDINLGGIETHWLLTLRMIPLEK